MVRQAGEEGCPAQTRGHHAGTCTGQELRPTSSPCVTVLLLKVDVTSAAAWVMALVLLLFEACSHLPGGFLGPLR